MSEGEKFLQTKYGTEKRANAFYKNQMLHFLNQDMIAYIARQTMVFISTSDSEGNCDASFRVGQEGFVYTIDAQTLMYPEYRGNGVMASLGNISENPHIGLMFVDFFEDQIGLHINGRAEIVENDHLPSFLLSNEQLTYMNQREGDKAERWVYIKVEEAYVHCSKHIPKLKKEEKAIHWGTNNKKYKGGDYFHARRTKHKENSPY
ncbi:pyridoxamine 5'-phosphate oxidase family protein [Gracilibacillus caseinilyticus]|uniref:Pyridoxamine 5'-phosphate oxidase family protein n=1 Tax=Gracilibacillus caseinilyticus TaxID=2932256 RepID=A0ABY4EY53_9BACI|nr:pyridoxamine 5'-phosphate oxidase family protein [Gracilibacillus caseinilyticus]UOQ49215.1 pyridoxamine 5'-phosphate oxidase family protein [Gracilibacillus caseinilyticus]